MKYKDYYEILGLERGASQEDVKRSYRKLARKYHPDISKHTDAEDRFKELGEAYDVLKDPEKRAAYDRMGSEWRNGQDFQPPPNWDEGFEFSGAGNEAGSQADFHDLFESIFGGAREARSRRHAFNAQGEDHHAKVLIDLEDAYRGAKRSISLQVPMIDTQGHVTLESRTLDVSIPKGIRAGQHLRLSGQGAPGATPGTAGDLYLEIGFREHPRFRVDGCDVSLELPVTPWEAALGAHIAVPTPDGSVEMTVPPGSGDSRRLRLKGKGIPANPPGDLYVILNIVLPPADNDSAKAAYDAMRQAFNFDPRAHFYG
ncbi:Curved DNA-binding protein [Paraburkholderia domus]|jgi:DnaJ-class molecular chaperone with C-terminal Zn finger domain|uniref:Curved DNA-binding protein n=1 Tax=Paraburkholderia domus TaxID=2793075 RepID=A0A9N8N3E0_9BURK|nr:DnaJ C-terminal domain-containing protein [Paraburkholderia domus]MBK5052206.1 DnaJ domain-containing protein [Burkholderia sp. R-70006]MBK5064361.1 DnaJ domain-containing protein [Burkholderia sp. R-70199]MBK5089172.1 DnaJ domain-containing protein [Burkholderia sp. R-69927]MBK5122645.1 DnaJ domain-containing protein [Burkholderia sp. R-69980]MBK5168334.1 DnaJ domain-containing protein [Burkholderia sp. R-70211]MBK5183492.1 DnaJ domain-containing protein [Burkholderia sp. R-69749]MCI0149